MAAINVIAIVETLNEILEVIKMNHVTGGIEMDVTTMIHSCYTGGLHTQIKRIFIPYWAIKKVEYK